MVPSCAVRWGVLDKCSATEQLQTPGVSCKRSTSSASVQLIHWCYCVHSGGLSGLSRKWNNGRQGAQWASSKTPLGRFMYSTYTEEDYKVIWDQYQYVSRSDDWWFRKDFGKQDLDTHADTNRSNTYATVQQTWSKQVLLSPLLEASSTIRVALLLCQNQDLLRYCCWVLCLHGYSEKDHTIILRNLTLW